MTIPKSNSIMNINSIVMDFDGTCTQIPLIYEAFLEQYLQGLNETVFVKSPVTKDEWDNVEKLVRSHSPEAAWTITTTPSAPAAADPYILSLECAKYLLRSKNLPMDIPGTVYGNAATNHPAPWREEAKEVFNELLRHDINIIIMSNTSSVTITKRLQELFSSEDLPKGVSVKSGAQKYCIAELDWDSSIPKDTRKKFHSLPVVDSHPSIDRPVYIRRGMYFESICNAFNNDLKDLDKMVFCGDIWEMDLAMPYALGAKIHLIERAEPFPTYDFERKATLHDMKRGKISDDLSGLLEWIK
jgi:hypothetical protein